MVAITIEAPTAVTDALAAVGSAFRREFPGVDYHATDLSHGGQWCIQFCYDADAMPRTQWGDIALVLEHARGNVPVLLVAESASRGPGGSSADA